MEHFIVTDDPCVFSALIDAGFVPLSGIPTETVSQSPLYYVLNSPNHGIPDSCKGRCIYTNRMTLGKAVNKHD